MDFIENELFDENKILSKELHIKFLKSCLKDLKK